MLRQLVRVHAGQALRASRVVSTKHALVSSTSVRAFSDETVKLPKPHTLGGIEFTDLGGRLGEKRRTGRAWEASELRTKSYDDLHKLWYVCLKERSMLQSELHIARATKVKMINPERYKKCKLTMNRIKVVVGERTRAHQLILKEERSQQWRDLQAAFKVRRDARMAAQAEGLPWTEYRVAVGKVPPTQSWEEGYASEQAQLEQEQLEQAAEGESFEAEMEESEKNSKVEVK